MNILEEAAATTAERGLEYSPPEEDHKCIMQIWDALLEKSGREVTVEMVPLFMIGVKLSRLVNNPTHRDSMVDIAGYARVLEMLSEVDQVPT